MTKAETLAAQLTELSLRLREAEMTLAKRRAQMLYPKDKEYTDFDRQIRLEADTATEQRDAALLRDHYEIRWQLFKLLK